MAKLNRVTGKVFGATASPTGDVNNGAYIGQFGSAQAGTFVGTDDIATIQNLSAWNNGWIDAVMEEDKLPPLPERTGVDKVLSYQECYLLQQGIAEWDSATDYYINCYCSYDGVIYKSLTDSNTNNQPDVSPVNWEVYGKVSLYTKFAINKGAIPLLIDNSNELAFDVDNTKPLTYTNIMGETRTVTALSSIDVSGTPYDVPFTQPTLTANGTLGGVSFAVSATSERGGYPAYNAINGGYWVSSGDRPQTYIIYSPEPLKISTLYFAGNSSGVYNPISYTIEVSNDNISYTTVYTATNESVRYGKTFNLNLNNYYNYIKINVTDIDASSGSNDYNVAISNIKITATYQMSTGDGTYKVALPNTGSQPYLFNGNVFIQEDEPTTQVQGDIWLNPQELYTAKQFDGSNWQDFNDVILLDSSVTVLSGVVSDLEQPKYISNHIDPKYQNNPQIVETYQNAYSWYRVYSDGWCEQGGIVSEGTSSVILLKSYASTTYSVLLSNVRNQYSSNYDAYTITANNKFSLYQGSSGSINWKAYGYIN